MMEFKRIVQLCGIALLAGVFLAGCGKEGDDAAAETFPLDGHWLLSITQEYDRSDYRDVTTVLLEIHHDAGRYQAKIVGNKPALPDPVLKQFNVNGDKVKLVIKSDEYAYDFEGRVNGSLIRGNVDQGGLVIEPARLEKKKFSEIAEAMDFPATEKGLEYQVLLNAAQADKGGSISLSDHYQDFNEYCLKHGEAALAVIVSHMLVNVAPHEADSEDDVKVFAKQYLKRSALWGERMETLARFNLGRSLCRHPEFAELGLAYLEKAESSMDAARRDELKQDLALIRQSVETNKTRAEAAEAFALAKAGDAEGLKILGKLNHDAPFDPLIIYQRAEAARLLGETEEAMRLNAQLATWPGMQGMLQQEPIWQAGERKLPEGLLFELSAQRNEKQFHMGRYRYQIFDEAVYRIAYELQRSKVEPEGNRTSVVELFTGAGCIPCISADLATAALERVYPSSHLIVLRHHLNSAGFDPLVCPQNMERFESLLGPDQKNYLATPTVFINGKRPAFDVGGQIKDAIRIGSRLQDELKPLLQQTSPLKLKLTADQRGDTLSISAKLAGAADDNKDKLRVHLILAESLVNYIAPNGIRRHEMLTRWYANEGKPIEASSAGDFAYAEDTSLNLIRDFLKLSNDSAAEALGAKPATLPILLEDLKLVALVQDAETGEILQAAVQPVKVESALKLPELPAGPSFGPNLGKPEADLPKGPKPAEAEKPPKNTGPQLLFPEFPS